MHSYLSMTEIDSFIDRCSARTRAGRQCKNPVLGYQFWSPTLEILEELPDGLLVCRRAGLVADGDIARMRAQVCRVHEETHSAR